jgi:hypothetical protein
VTAPEIVLNAAGVPNLLKYAFDLNPRDPSQPQLYPDIVAAGQILSFRRRSHATDLQFSFESSTDMITWSPIATEQLAVAPPKENGELATYRIRESATPLFIRVRVSFR